MAKKHEFSGILLSVLLFNAGIEKTAGKVTAIARSNYSIPL
jgi:hypothetical protein